MDIKSFVTLAPGEVSFRRNKITTRNCLAYGAVVNAEFDYGVRRFTFLPISVKRVRNLIFMAHP
jgi:hypothetical protein